MIVVTGGAGFIGSNLVAALQARGQREIVVCDRLGSGDQWRNLAKRELADLIAPQRLLGYLDRNSRQIEAVFHLGAVSATTATDADDTIATNFGLSLALWEWSAAAGKRFFYASSAATYGDGAAGFDDDGSAEGLARLRPLNLYGWSKHLFDRRVARIVQDGGARPPQWAGLKFFNVYGPNEYHKGPQQSVIAHVYPKIAAKGDASLFRSHRDGYADGEQRRDFVWVGDCADVMLWLLENPQVNGIFNVGTGKARSFNDLARAIFQAVGRAPSITYRDMPAEIRDKYQYHTEARMERLRAAGYDKAFTALEDGVGHYVREYLATPDPYR